MAGAIESCVHCGFCLPTCPTYATMGEEMDSPRGRIFLMKEVLEGQLELEAALPYVDNCLGCRPARPRARPGVAYGELITPLPRLRRGAPPPRSRRPRPPRAGPADPPPPAALPRGGAAGPTGAGGPCRACCRSPWARCCASCRTASRRARPLPAVHPAEGPRRARVALLAGCAQQVLAPDIGWATLRVLARNGVETVVPRAQGCCGSLALHAGAADQARRAARRNLGVFPDDVDAVITNAAGCGSGMREYGLLFAGEPEQGAAERLAGRVLDVSAFLADLGVSAPPPPAVRPATIAYHDACHLAHAQGVRDAPRALLARDRRRHARGARRVGAVLRVGGHLQRREAGHRRRAGRAQGAQPPGHRARTSWPRGNIGCLTQVQTHLRALGARGPGRAHRPGPRPRLRARSAGGPVVSGASVRHAGLDERSRTEILSPDAVAFVAELHARFGPRRRELLAARRERRDALRRGGTLDFLPETRDVREADWRVAPPRPDYADRRVEITGPTDRKLVINALNSGARGFMADFEDANSPTWRNQVSGHANLVDAIEGTITYESSDGRRYALGDDVATLLVRPRGLHLDEKHLRVAATPVAGALVDFGLFAFHAASRLLARGSAPYLYLPKLEHHLEARLWNDVFTWTEEALGLPHGSIRATVLIETLPAAFQMEEILFELREHSYGLNAGRWDYIFSMIKLFRDRPEFVLPDRADVRMTVPFMRSYSELLVATCHRRGAFAMGGMAALIPSRTDPEANARAVDAVRADKEREAGDGFDGTWVAHPDVVGVARGPSTPCSATARTRSTAAATTSWSPPPSCSTPAPRRARSPRRACATTSRRLPVHLLLARRPRRRRHRQPHGGRRDGRDLPLAALAVGPPRRAARGRAGRHARARAGRARRGDGPDPRRRRRRGLGEGAPGRHPRAVRARRAGRRLPGVPDPARLRAAGLRRADGRRRRGRRWRAGSWARDRVGVLRAGPGARAGARGRDVLHLEIGEPRFPTPPHVVEAAVRGDPRRRDAATARRRAARAARRGRALAGARARHRRGARARADRHRRQAVPVLHRAGDVRARRRGAAARPRLPDLRLGGALGGRDARALHRARGADRRLQRSARARSS